MDIDSVPRYSKAYTSIPTEVIQYECAVATTETFDQRYPLRKNAHWVYLEEENEIAKPFTREPLDIDAADSNLRVIEQIEQWEALKHLTFNSD